MTKQSDDFVLDTIKLDQDFILVPFSLLDDTKNSCVIITYCALMQFKGSTKIPYLDLERMTGLSKKKVAFCVSELKRLGYV